ncbi:PstS family phosphate ABC transporter substrate-binding protein [Flavobacterium aciduliphilum]|uniref:Phosphate ABC transporter substrate-binding protein (PhoT family) n=1 Tax=Flavobacterium aciduliphilum TaxID=1101402 RepID=A0A328YJ57_9FLAO|nr:substrate-binding domain-containing protein [Flavobacterium aciduliphilum]RAR74188.1 phosphate ABC transporter substrate-binding protein (PhoT family) [Flavobacterium aciduliphilum]
MIKNSSVWVLFMTVVIFVFYACKKQEESTNERDTIVEGKMALLVDEALVPIVEDQVQVFENTYKASIAMLPLSEKECVSSLAKGKVKVAVLSRKLSPVEESYFKTKNIVPRTTAFATDAIAFISKKSTHDTLIALQDVVAFIQGKNKKFKGLVFDNPNSSAARMLCEKAKVEELPVSGTYSFKTNDEVIKYVAENENMIGVVGLNWIAQPKPSMQAFVNQVSVMSVRGDSQEYVYPSQDNLAMQKYPLARDLYLINCQGYEGLGIGLASFMAGEKGQRIVLKSGLSPIRIPSRKINIRKQIENESK